MRDYRTINMVGAGDFIASVSGVTTDYDITLDDGTVLEGYDETAGTFSTAAPVAGDLLVFGIINGQRLISVANAEVVPADMASAFVVPADPTV
jgi:hypothetical protein